MGNFPHQVGNFPHQGKSGSGNKEKGKWQKSAAIQTQGNFLPGRARQQEENKDAQKGFATG